MGRSNNQLRRTAKAKGVKVFIPKTVKSKVKNQARKMKIVELNNGFKRKTKLDYGKVKTKQGKIVSRKFKSTQTHKKAAPNRKKR